MIRAIIVDCDGVLVDSSQANTAFYQGLLPAAGYPMPTAEEVLSCFHVTLTHSSIKLTGTDDEAEVQRISSKVHDTSLRHPELFRFPPALPKTLEQLKRGYALAIATSRLSIGLTEVLRAGNIATFFFSQRLQSRIRQPETTS